MHLYLSPHSGKPIYVQIVEQVKHGIASGQLGPGDELPRVRGLAQQLVVNPNTVLRAYQELEHLGLVVRKQGSGTYVSDGASPLGGGARRKLMAEKADALLYDAQLMGFSYEELRALLEERRQTLVLNESLRTEVSPSGEGKKP